MCVCVCVCRLNLLYSGVSVFLRLLGPDLCYDSQTGSRILRSAAVPANSPMKRRAARPPAAEARWDIWPETAKSLSTSPISAHYILRLITWNQRTNSNFQNLTMNHSYSSRSGISWTDIPFQGVWKWPRLVNGRRNNTNLCVFAWVWQYQNCFLYHWCRCTCTCCSDVAGSPHLWLPFQWPQPL